MSTFDVDFSESLQQLAEFQLRLANMGKALDSMETKSNKVKSASSRLLRQMSDEYDKLEKHLVDAGIDAEKLGMIMQRVRNDVTNLMSGVAASNLKATVQAKALNGEFSEMGRLLNDTASKNTYSSWLTKTAQITNRLQGENGYLRASLASLSSEEGKLNAELKASLSTKQKLIASDTKLRLLAVEQSAALSSLLTEQGRINAINQVTIRARREEVTETARLDATLKSLERQLKSLSGGQQEQITRVQAQISARKAAIREELSEKKAVDELTQALKREENQLVRLRAQAQLMTSEHGKQVSAIRVQIAEQERLNRLQAMSVPQLLGLSNNTQRLNLAQQAGSQLAASFRAGITGLHASFGMYTSATILAASATYAFTAGLRDSILTGAEFYDTMARTRAIMSSGGPQWLGDQGSTAAALEGQVRALGMTTIYTASEVGQGLQELGKAGFGASDAISALPAALQLANLANVSMARSADIATNVLMTFGMQARELGSVVDLMATAVNNSNTDIEQLANAISYVGPAAETAGYSLQETVAAIEALANSGFKASRAGTGLRRLMLSLVNPTKKGQAVLDEFGISVTDAEGNARTLTNVVGQLSKAFESLSGPEQLAAVQNLVGTYATPQVSALIAQYENLKKFVDQNSDVGGAADRMEAIINQSLSKDWKQLMSSIEEAQLTAFNRLDMRLRELTASASVWVLSMLEPVGKLADRIGADGQTIEGAQFNQLDIYLANAERAAVAISQALAGVLAFKFASGNVMNSFAADASKASESLSVLATKLSEKAVAQAAALRATTATTASLNAMNVAAVTGTTSLAGLSAGLAVATRWAGYTATALGVLSRALGWVGLIYGIGTAISTYFGSSAQEDLEANAGKVDDIRDSYARLREEIDQAGLSKQRAALDQQLKSEIENVEAIEARLDLMLKAQNDLKEAGLEPDLRLSGEIKNLERMLADYGNRVWETDQKARALGTSTADYDDKMKAHAKTLSTVASLTLSLASAQNEVTQAMQLAAAGDLSGTGMLTNAQARVEALRRELNEAVSKVNDSKQQVALSVELARPASETVASLRSESEIEAEKAAYDETASNSQKLLDLQVKLTEAKRKTSELIDRDNAALAEYADLNKKGHLEEAALARARRPGLKEVENAVKTETELQAQVLEAQKKVNEELRTYEQQRSAANSKNLTDAENLANAKARDLELTRLIAQAENPEEGKAKDLVNLTKLYQEQAQVRQQINMASNASGKTAAKSATDQARALQEAVRLYEQLEKRIDPAAAALTELNKQTEAMNLLVAEGVITTDQQAKAVAQLRKAHYEASQAADKHAKALADLRENYIKSPFDTAVNDLAKMNALLNEGKISLEEYSRIYGSMQRQQREKAVSGLPTANLTTGDASSSPFTDWVSTEIERANGLSQFEARQKEMAEGLAMRQEQIRIEAEMRRAALEAEQLDQQAHSARMLEIKQQEHDQWLASQQEFGVQYQAVATQQSQYAEAMGKMALISAMGAAQNLLGMFASAAEDASTAQKVAFVAQKAMAVAQIIMYTELAAAQALAVSGNPILGMPLSTFIRATGYANAGLVAALSIGEIATGGQSGGSTRMYDTGGYIPYNRQGIVGEYGPELVTGPAHVKGRGATASKLSKEKGQGMQFTYAPSFPVTIESGAQVSEEEIRRLGSTLEAISKKQMAEAVRPNGILDNWMRQKTGK